MISTTVKPALGVELEAFQAVSKTSRISAPASTDR